MTRAPGRRLSWCYEDCIWFLENLTMPEGGNVLVEGYVRLILRIIFLTSLVELLCLLPKGNGKTTIMAGLAVFHLLTVPSPRVFIAAADVEQAKEMFSYAQHYCESEPAILRLVKITESTRTIRLRKNAGGGYIKVLASDKSKSGGKKHSYSPTLALVDELHAAENTAVYVALRSALFKGKRPGVPGMETSGLIAVISTAGHNKKSVLGVLRTAFLAVEQKGGALLRGATVNPQGFVVHGEGNPEQIGQPLIIQGEADGRLNVAVTANGANVMLEWACTDQDDLCDMRVVKLANPASFVTPVSLLDALQAPGITPWDFARYRANVWTLAFKSWVPTDSWDPMFDPLLRVVTHRTWQGAHVDELRDHIGELFPWGSVIYAAVDMARYRDCAAIGLIWPREARAKAVRALVWETERDLPIAYGPVEDALRALHAVYRVMAIGWDPKYFDNSAERLTGEGLPMVMFPQSNERMCPAAGDARAEIIAGKWAHDGDPILKAHILAASAHDISSGQFKVDKAEESGPPIDACEAVLMANALSKVPRPKVSAESW